MFKREAVKPGELTGLTGHLPKKCAKITLTERNKIKTRAYILLPVDPGQLYCTKIL
jgi:hypothetical protein